MRSGRWLLYGGAVLVALIIGFWNPVRVKAGREGAPRFRVDASWPQALPAPVGYDLYNWPGCGPEGCQNTATPGGDNAAHRWVMGEVAGSCTDAQGNVYTYNRGWQLGSSGAVVGQDASDFTGATPNPDRAMPSPPVVAFDANGRTFAGFGNPGFAAGRSTYMPNSAHGCFVDYKGYLWVAGNGDGIVQKYNPATAASQGAQATALLQIGTKDVCDSATQPCSGAALNSSHTLLYNPPDMAVDPDVGPVSGSRGDIYIADGYGNYRIVVFKFDGTYVGQWGQSCGHNENPDGTNACPGGTFGANGGGHPHCVVLGKDGLVYVCDRPNNRIQVFKKTCAVASSAMTPQPLCPPDRVIYINQFPGATAANRNVILRAGTRACDMDFWPNKDALVTSGQQRYIIDVDLGNDNTWVIDKDSGITVGAVGRCGLAPCPGHNAAEFAFGHTVNVAPDNKTIYVAETITGRRIQKFVKVDDDDDDHGKDDD